MTMGPILTKAQMTEEDIKLQFITPAITARWPKEHITMEQKITDGKINLKGNLVVREKPKKADYVLYLQANLPIAIVEAKDNNHSVSYGLQQAMTYATISLLQEKGTMLPKPVCKHFSDKKHSWLWELRPGGDRVLFFAWTGGAFVLLHAFKKKSQKTPDAELRRAEREYKDWIERNGEI